MRIHTVPHSLIKYPLMGIDLVPDVNEIAYKSVKYSDLVESL